MPQEELSFFQKMARLWEDWNPLSTKEEEEEKERAAKDAQRFENDIARAVTDEEAAEAAAKAFEKKQEQERQREERENTKERTLGFPMTAELSRALQDFEHHVVMHYNPQQNPHKDTLVGVDSPVESSFYAVPMNTPTVAHASEEDIALSSRG